MDSLRVPGDFASLKKIRDFVTSAAANVGLDKRRAYRLSLAVDEIATNVITHGYDEVGLAGEILVHAQVIENGLQITIEDAGKPYNPLLHREPDNLDSQLEDRAIGGLGIFLALKNVDEFRYEYTDGANHNILVMKQTSTSSEATNQGLKEG
jgi:anti-sigma regulatory factor (Ser/Thr protein kinase)